MELTAAYWRHYNMACRGDRQQRLAAEELDWAEDEVRQALVEPISAVSLLVALADAAPDEEALGYLGAGPIEELLARSGSAVVDQVDAAARGNDRFRYALRCAWFEGKVPEPDGRRLRRFGPRP